MYVDRLTKLRDFGITTNPDTISYNIDILNSITPLFHPSNASVQIFQAGKYMGMINRIKDAIEMSFWDLRGNEALANKIATKYIVDEYQDEFLTVFQDTYLKGKGNHEDVLLVKGLPPDPRGQ